MTTRQPNESATFAGVSIEAGDIVPWNAYPWYVNAAPTAAQLDAGVAPWVELIALMPDLKVVMLHGGSARDGWKRVLRAHPALSPIGA